ncbi:MAG TPA: carboxypeptidase-like regulatory domain-containing protein, partial [Candidatus Saccharimonadales bacterium]|nr:carboxypeptidase-like regulatory domain-containing protein [Candidatus Saccharimonadales bacterium]
MKSRLIPMVILFLTFAVGASAQSNQGAIAGTILDPSGAVVAGARVTATSNESGAKYEVVSSDAGYYNFAHLNIGTYDVTINVTGFKVASLKGVVVQIGTTSSLDITLVQGSTSETVIVDADTPRVQTESSEIGTVITATEMTNLPLPLGSVVQAMRSPEAFVFLTPGAVGPGTANGNGGTFESKISGGQNYATEVLLDGVSMFRSENGSSFDETAPSVDALAEFKVTTSTLPAELGRTTGGIESFTTKAGTNSFHGGAYELFQNEDLNANTFFNNGRGIPRPLDKKNDYGLFLGGPVWLPKLYNGRDKTHFFFAWEQFRQTSGAVTTSTVPTAAERGGDFSDLLGAPLTQTGGAPVLNPCNGQQMIAGQIFDPSTTQTVGGQLCRLPFAGNIIPSSSFSEAGLNIISHYPDPTNSSPVLNYDYPFSFPILDTTMTIRLDH